MDIQDKRTINKTTLKSSGCDEVQAKERAYPPIVWNNFLRNDIVFNYFKNKIKIDLSFRTWILGG